MEVHGQDGVAGAVLVRQGEDVIVTRGFGLANRAEAIPNGTDTRFAIASGAKLFTAIAINQLVDGGRRLCPRMWRKMRGAL